MTILADQCVNRDVIEELKKEEFKIICLSEVNLSSASDSEIFDYALENDYVLLTFDKDFGNVLRFDIKSSAGVVIVYIEDMDKKALLYQTLYETSCGRISYK